MKNKLYIFAMAALLTACGGNSTQTGNADTTKKDSTSTPAAPAEAMQPDTSKTAKPDSQTKKASNNQEQYGPRKGAGG